MQLTISLIQFDAGMGHPDDTLEFVTNSAREAGRRGSDLTLLPELWYNGLDYERAAELATPLTEGAFAHMRRLARESRTHIAGSAFERHDDGIYNTLALFSPIGELISAYRKIHLFRPMSEDRQLQAGNSLVTARLPWGEFGLAICYDLRFPEMFRRYAVNGAVATLVPAQWPWARLDHWRTLTQARAIENQMFVCACNRVGFDGDVKFGGHSMICDPWGERLIEGGDAPALLTVNIDLKSVTLAHERIPVFLDRRPDIYSDF